MKKSRSLLIFVSVSFLVITAVSFGLLSTETSLTDEQKVMKIAVAYVEENYGIDYIIIGEVRNTSVTEGDIVYNYPTASFVIPSDHYERRMSVDIMVDPSTEEIVKVSTEEIDIVYVTQQSFRTL